jgi:hypothetical protein
MSKLHLSPYEAIDVVIRNIPVGYKFFQFKNYLIEDIQLYLDDFIVTEG